MQQPVIPMSRVNLRTEILLCAACGITMGSAYDIQGVIPSMAAAMGLNLSEAGRFPALTQLGLWSGVLALLPLGDLLEGRRLVFTVVLANVIALALSAFSTTSGALAVGCFLVGATTIVPYLLPPLASKLASSDQRSEMLARMTAATFAGIVISRAASVYLSDRFGWSTPFFLSAGLCLLVAVMLRSSLPALPVRSTARYYQVLFSLIHVFRSQKPLREAALTQGLQFATFNLFWIVLPIYLAGPVHHLSSVEISIFSALGLIGVLFIPVMARWVDRMDTGWISLIGTASVAIAWSLVGLFQESCWFLTAGGILVNFGVAASHVANQSSIFTLCQGERSRLAALYAMGTFTGGIVAAPAATALWSRFGWPGVCLTGAVLAIVTTLMQATRLARHSRAGNYGSRSQDA